MNDRIPIDAGELKRAAAGRWLEIIPAIDQRFTEAAKKAPNHVPCPIGTGSEDGFRFTKDSAGDGHAFTNTGEPLGDGLKVLQWANGWNFRETLLAVHHHLHPNGNHQQRPAPAQTTFVQENRQEERSRQPIVDRILSGAAAGCSKTVAAYLRRRGLESVIHRLPDSLKSHPGMILKDRGTSVGEFPALVGEISNPDNQVIGIQRHYLTPEGEKLALVDPEGKRLPSKSMLTAKRGAAKGGAVKFGKLEKGLCIAEGIETALAVWSVTEICTWATNTGTLLSGVEIPDEVETVYIWADKDRNGAGVKYPRLLAERVTAKGKAVPSHPPPLPIPDHAKGVDWLDALNQLGEKALIEAAFSCKTPLDPPTKRPVDQPVPMTPENELPPERYIPLTEYAGYFPEVTDKGRVLNTIENLEFMMGRYGIRCRYDVIKKDIEIMIPENGFSVDNQGNANRSLIKSVAQRNHMPVSAVDEYLTVIADKNQNNPVMNWITAKEWDGVPRLVDFMETVQTTNEALKMVLIKKWMISAVAAAARPNGLAAQGILVFVGEQGSGKTSWFKSLVPEWSDWAKDGLTLNPSEKDSVLTAISHWLVEIGELDATFRKADIAQLKSFVTKDTDKIRRPYDRVESTFPRRTVFFGSVNDEQFLVDSTGNRRYWTLNTTSIDFEHGFDMQQVWAEVWCEYLNGVSWWLTPEELRELNESNEDFQAPDPIEEALASTFDFDRPIEHHQREMTSTEILMEIGYDKPTRGQAMKVTSVLKGSFGKTAKRTKAKRFFNMPHLRVKNTGSY